MKFAIVLIGAPGPAIMEFRTQQEAERELSKIQQRPNFTFSHNGKNKTVASSQLTIIDYDVN